MLNIILLQHYFTLFKTSDGVYRFESYSDWKGPIYGPRLVEWPTYSHDIMYLLNCPSGINRVMYWNGLFNAREDHDADSMMIIDINFKAH